MMCDIDDTLESAGIDPATYCGPLFAWLITRRGHTYIGRNDWLTRDAAKEGLDDELSGLTASESSCISVCYIERQEWEDGQGLSVMETWPVDPATGCYNVPDPVPVPSYVRDHPIFSKIFPGL